jgi:uncharacterized membrane protein YphA (DoxX/SURF4 family)
METIKILLQATIAIAIINVWILRRGKPTQWRGGAADSLEKEFETYGLPPSIMVTAGALKITCALLLIVGFWIPPIVRFAAAGMTVLLLVAVIAHLRIQDPIRKAIPAASLMSMSASLLFL